MSEPCAIYSTRIKPVTAEELRSMAGDARVEISGGPNAWTTAEIHWPDCTVQMNRMEGEQIVEHLNGFKGFVFQCSEQHTPGEMHRSTFAILQRLAQVNQVYGTVSEPVITPQARHFLQALALSGRGLIFHDVRICNCAFEPLLGPGQSPTNSPLDYWPDAVERKNRNEAFLKAQGVPVLSSLPPLPGNEGVSLRDTQTVAERCVALLAIASYAVPDGISRKEARTILNAHPNQLSPNEAAFLKKWFPGQQEKIQFGWRFEALWVLLWALRLVPHLEEPLKPIAVSDIDKPLAGGVQKLFQASLRPISEILDTLDRTYRYHWATREAGVKGTPAPIGIDSGVVQERHHALNWLIHYKSAEWDDVRTDT